MWPLIRLVPRETSFNFVGLAPFAAVLSALLLIGSVASFVTQGMNFGVDFAGGTVLEITTPGPAPVGEIRSFLGTNGVHDAQVQEKGGANSAMVRFRSVEGQTDVSAPAFVKGKLETAFPGLKVVKQDSVGAKVSGELLWGGAKALLSAILLMLLYIWFRFQLQFGLGAVIALFHDIALTIGMLSVAQLEISTTSIAALLTVIGYSMNEKVITFDRLRENLRKYKTTPLRDVINLSENERLSRTIITGTTALLALSGAFFFGGPSLFALVATMCFGIIIGTYSSIVVSAPMLIYLNLRTGGGEPEPAKPPKPTAAKA